MFLQTWPPGTAPPIVLPIDEYAMAVLPPDAIVAPPVTVPPPPTIRMLYWPTANAWLVSTDTVLPETLMPLPAVMVMPATAAVTNAQVASCVVFVPGAAV